MEAEKKPRFSHVSIGNTERKVDGADEAEVVMAIGAVEDVPAEFSSQMRQPSNAATEPAMVPGPADVEIDDELLPAMPRLQKIILAVCAVGLIATV
ncbi:MAG: hypothetical protein LBR39_07725, partial [Coriobacteriales bacterium]|nr:hypothetical protein [Coriobacteriales bacterium]